MSTLVGRMPAGAVDLGGSAQAASAGYPVGAIHFGPAWEDDDYEVQLTHKGWSQITDGMAKSIVRLECEADELRAEVALLQEQARILARERERWQMQAEQKWGMRRELEELLGVKDTESDEQFAKGLASLRNLIQERDEARDAFSIATGNCVDAQRRLREMEDQRDFAMGEMEPQPRYANPEVFASDRAASKPAARTTDEAPKQSNELLALALAKTIDQLKAEKAAIFAKLVSLQAGSRRATLEEIAESVREKYDPEYEREEIEN